MYRRSRYPDSQASSPDWDRQLELYRNPSLPSHTTPDIYLNGYISNAFGPDFAQKHFQRDLMIDTASPPHWAVPGYFKVALIPPPRKVVSALPVTISGIPRYVLDHFYNPNLGNIVPQQPQVKRLPGSPTQELPIFFIQGNGDVGVTVEQAIYNQYPCGVVGSSSPAPVGNANVWNISFTIAWPGYKVYVEPRKVLVLTKKGKSDRVRIDLGGLLYRVASAAHHFFDHCERDYSKPVHPELEIGGPRGVDWKDVYLVGLVNVAEGVWQPIFRMPRFVLDVNSHLAMVR
ncbi:hypothetical protein FA95DRAFT_1605523 [Auriscalpium vulgare]|uniref:Uncharacterized protein n=1 Tax=Auriscalpium vulgare TaxID=40419 RepID=A0ACB8RVL2_9AGAM|nr:hypothetical protein FA95DRAFT_1605523 [Auriscalpium vulgare]